MFSLFGRRLDERLKYYEELVRDAADIIRPCAVDSESHGTFVPVEKYPEPLLRATYGVGLPVEYRPDLGQNFSGLNDDQIRVLVAYAGGFTDLASALTCPGPSLAGAAVEALGSPEQRDRFFTNWTDCPSTRSFFGVTEPKFGTNAHLMETRIDLDSMTITGHKKFIGNLVNASVGVVFGRVFSGPLGIRAVMMELPQSGATVSPLDLVGMRSAGLGELSLGACSINEEDLLGEQLKASKRGLWGLTRVFLRMRLQVAASALGAGAALLDTVSSHEAANSAWLRLASEGAHLQHFLWSAVSADNQSASTDSETVASVCKLKCVAWAMTVAAYIYSTYHHRGLSRESRKTIRDIVGLEFMEGVSAKQRSLIARRY